MSGKASGSKGLPRVRMLRSLNAWWYVIYDAYGFAVRMPRQRVRNDMVLHLPGWLVARLHTVDSFTSGTLETAVLVAIIVHGHQTLEMVLVSTLR